MYMFRNAILFILCAMMSGCFNLAGDISRDEVARIASPSGSVEAVLVETNGGATTSFGYDVYVTEPGKQYAVDSRVAHFYAAVRSKSAYGVNFVWDGDQKLIIKYLDAKIEKVSIPQAVVGNSTINIVLQKGVEDSAAPPGGMLYNLQGRPHG